MYFINNHATEISKPNVIVSYIFIVISRYLSSLNILDEVTILFVGDISFSEPIKYYVDHKYHTYNDTFNDVAPFIREADISVGNLESPFANQYVLTHLYRGRKTVLLYAIPKAASALRWWPYFHYCLSSVHHCEDRLHIHSIDSFHTVCSSTISRWAIAWRNDSMYKITFESKIELRS